MTNVFNISDGTTFISSSNKSDHLKHGGGDGTSGDMEARVKRLEDDGKELRADLKTIIRDLGDIKAKLSGIDGRINAMPTTWQMVGFVVALALAIFTIIRVALPIG